MLVGIGLFWLAIWIGCGVWASSLASNKGRSAGGFFFLGLLLGLIGVVIAACVAPAPAAARAPLYGPYPGAPAYQPATPPGWYPDPYGTATWRWFDGTAWTGYTH